MRDSDKGFRVIDKVLFIFEFFQRHVFDIEAEVTA